MLNPPGTFLLKIHSRSFAHHSVHSCHTHSHTIKNKNNNSSSSAYQLTTIVQMPLICCIHFTSISIKSLQHSFESPPMTSTGVMLHLESMFGFAQQFRLQTKEQHNKKRCVSFSNASKNKCFFIHFLCLHTKKS